jgi:hypothetical protein
MQLHAGPFFMMSNARRHRNLHAETKHESERNSLLPLKAKKQFFTKVGWTLNIAILASSIDKTRREK